MSNFGDAQLPLDDSAVLVSTLRERLARSLQELSSCRELLRRHEIPYESAFSGELDDHADVLEAPCMTGNKVIQEVGCGTASFSPAILEEAGVAASLLTAGVEPAMMSEPTSVSSQEVTGPPAAAELLVPAGTQNIQATTGSVAAPVLQVKSREHERLEEELSMAKALLMLNNVTLNMDFDHDEGGDTSAVQVVNLKGSRRLIQLLITLKQKVSLLNQQYLLLRGDMLYLNHEMNVCRHWVLQSFRAAMLHQSSEHSSLQSRFERLSKVLN